MIDDAGRTSMAGAADLDERIHAELGTIRAWAEHLAEHGLNISDVEIADMRRSGLSNDAIALLIDGTPEQLRSVLGSTAAFVVKRGLPWGPTE